MRRVMSLWLPRWPIDRRRWQRQSAPDDSPFVLAAAVGNARLVTAVNESAEALGITPGLPLADARALFPALGVAEADPAADAAALERLAGWCRRYSPWTAPQGGDGIWLDVTGCAHLAGGEANLAGDVVARLRAQGIACRAAIADTQGAAWAVARRGGAQSAVVPPGGARAAIATLPVTALRLDPVQSSELERLGLRRIGDLYALPRAALARRFGKRVAARLDEALGEAPEPLSPLSPAPPRWARRHFAEPITAPEALAAASGELLQSLCRALAEEELGARLLTLTCHRVDGVEASVGIGTARPNRDARHLLRLFAERLGTIDPGLGIEDMLLAARRVERLEAVQIGMSFSARRASPEAVEHGREDGGRIAGASFDKLRMRDMGNGIWQMPSDHAPHPELVEGCRTDLQLQLLKRAAPSEQRSPGEGAIVAFPAGQPVARQLARALLAAEGRDRDGTDQAELAQLIDRLANRLGVAAVGRPAPVESHVPERAVRVAPIFAAAAQGWTLDQARPVRLLPRPEPIEATALMPDDPPVLFRWRRLQHRVRRADGPERIAGEWWRGAEAAAELRDYYRVEDEEGRRFWLYRAGLYRDGALPRWFLHGLFA